MKYSYVTIEREYGSGGTEIGKLLAAECGIAFYGREILEEVAKRLNTTVDRIERYEETTTNSLMYSVLMMSHISSGNSSMLSGEDRIFLEEQTAIQSMAHNGPAVFMGHCAVKALEGRRGVLRVFIHALPQDKKMRAQEQYHIAPERAEDTMKKFDKKRGNYYYANTGKQWTDADNYDIILNSSRLGTDGCVKVLKKLMR